MPPFDPSQKSTVETGAVNSDGTPRETSGRLEFSVPRGKLGIRTRLTILSLGVVMIVMGYTVRQHIK